MFLPCVGGCAVQQTSLGDDPSKKQIRAAPKEMRAARGATRTKPLGCDEV
jgi:hypothetical protein